MFQNSLITFLLLIPNTCFIKGWKNAFILVCVSSDSGYYWCFTRCTAQIRITTSSIFSGYAANIGLFFFLSRKLAFSFSVQWHPFMVTSEQVIYEFGSRIQSLFSLGFYIIFVKYGSIQTCYWWPLRSKSDGMVSILNVLSRASKQTKPTLIVGKLKWLTVRACSVGYPVEAHKCMRTFNAFKNVMHVKNWKSIENITSFKSKMVRSTNTVF